MMVSDVFENEFLLGRGLLCMHKDSGRVGGHIFGLLTWDYMYGNLTLGCKAIVSLCLVMYPPRCWVVILYQQLPLLGQ